VTETRESRTPSRDREAKQPLPARLSLFYRQVVAELRKVIWPTRRELITYTTVVIFFVLVVIAYVSVLDFAFAKAILSIFG
jgi:preprotein translocase subunit SecE